MSAVLFLVGSCTTCWWAILIWPLPLWCQSWLVPLRWYDALIWYTIAAVGHYGSIGVGLYRLSYGPWYGRVIIPMVVFMYYCGVTLLWIWFSSIFSSLIKAEPIFMTMWAITTWLYITFITDYSLIACGVPEGFLLFSPLIPLGEVPVLLVPLYWCGERLFLFVVLCTQAFFAWCIIKKFITVRCFFYCLLIGSPLVWISKKVSQRYVACNSCPTIMHIGVITSQFCEKNVVQSHRHLVAHIRDLISDYPQTSCVIFPESSVYAINAFPEKGECVQGLLDCKDKTVIIGGFRKQGNVVYNTVWYITEGKVIDYFDKQYILPLTEFAPCWMQWLGDKNPFFENIPAISPSDTRSERPLWEIIPGFQVVPYICSELFTAHKPRDQLKAHAVLVLCNNIWAPRLLRWLMMRVAVFRAIAWRRTVIYIAHDYASMVTPYGMRWDLKKESHICGI